MTETRPVSDLEAMLFVLGLFLIGYGVYEYFGAAGVALYAGILAVLISIA
jgi:hypothetical protein